MHDGDLWQWYRGRSPVNDHFGPLTLTAITGSLWEHSEEWGVRRHKENSRGHCWCNVDNYFVPCQQLSTRMKVDIWPLEPGWRVISSILGMGDTKWIQHSWHSALQAINYVHYANINKSVRERPDNKLDYILSTMSLLNSFYLMICGNFYRPNFLWIKMRHIRWGQNYHLVWTSNIIWQYFVRVFAGCCFWLIICKWCEKRENRDREQHKDVQIIFLLDDNFTSLHMVWTRNKKWIVYDN